MEEITLTAIDMIVKLFPMLKSVTGERRREYFDRVLSPLYKQFETIHDSYSQLITGTRDAIVRAGGDDELRSFTREAEQLPARTKRARILDEFLRKRQSDEHLRGAFRGEAQAFLTAVRWKEERRFLVLVCFYFLQRDGIAPTNDYLDDEAERVAREGSDKHWDTPSQRVYEALRNAESQEELLAVLDDARNHLNQRYMNVRHSFQTLHSTIVMET